MSSRSPRPLPRRLRRCVAQSLGCSLEQVDRVWHAGRVRVLPFDGGEPSPMSLEALVYEEDRVLLDGVALPTELAPAHALLNKPKHVTSSINDPNGAADLAPYLRQMPRGCFPVGRLDRESTGLLLFTNDGQLASAVLRPDHQTTKTYWLWLDDELSDDDPRLAELTSGVDHNGRRLVARAARLSARHDYATELELTLTQGHKRQIRHMCRVLDLHLVHLHRRQIGPLSDAGLALGDWRVMAVTEVESLWQAVGGRAALRMRKIAALEGFARTKRRAGLPELRLEHWLDTESAPQPTSLTARGSSEPTRADTPRGT